MKSFIFILLLSSLTQLFALTGTELILSEIRNQREDMRDMKKEIINIRADMKDIRTDMKDIRTDMKILREDVNFRLNFIQNLLYALMGLIFVSLFIAIYLRDKKELEDRKIIDRVSGLIFTLRELAEDNDKVAKSMRSANLM